MGGEQNGLLPVGKDGRLTRLAHAGVECRQRGLVEMAVADIVEQCDELCILLPIDCSELNGDILQPLQCFAVEEKRRGIDSLHIGPLLFGDHRCQLLHIANHQQLHPAKGTAAATVAPHDGIDGVEQVGTHHAYLIDDKQVHGADNVDFRLAQLPLVLGQLVFRHQFGDIGQIGAERQLEETVDGHPAGVDGGHTRGGHHHGAFGTVRGNVVQKSGLARPGLAGEED